MLRKLVKVVAKALAENGALAAGTEIGKAIGKRVAAAIYTPPPCDCDEDDTGDEPDAEEPAVKT